MSTAVASVRLEYQPGASVPVASPRVSWTTTTDVPGWRQLSAELSWDDGAATTNYQLDGDSSVLVAWPFAPLTPRQTGSLRVRVQGVDGWSGWSEPHALVAAFLAEGEWTAEFVGLPEPVRHAQPVLLRREFAVASGLVRATLYATALGVYCAEVNGTPVDDQLLKPGWTPYQYRLVHETTDVTALLSEGPNTIGVSLTGGWYTESFGFQGLAKPFYGTQPSFAGQIVLEYAGGRQEWIATGADWQASGDGPWTAAGIYAGEAYDARRSPSGWVPAEVRPAGPVPGPRTSPEVRVTQTVPVAEVTTSPSGTTLLDFGQNLVGRLRIRVVGAATLGRRSAGRPASQRCSRTASSVSGRCGWRRRPTPTPSPVTAWRSGRRSSRSTGSASQRSPAGRASSTRPLSSRR